MPKANHCLLFLIVLLSEFLVSSAWAQRRQQRSYVPDRTYELGVAAGTYDGESYTEFSGALNWKTFEPWLWRNAIFARSGSNSVVGLDSSGRYLFNLGEHSSFPMSFYAGPGLRISAANNMGPFVEAGGLLRLKGLAVGAGIKSIYLLDPGKDKNQKPRANQDTIISIIFAAGGSF